MSLFLRYLMPNLLMPKKGKTALEVVKENAELKSKRKPGGQDTKPGEPQAIPVDIKPTTTITTNEGAIKRKPEADIGSVRGRKL